ncbi:MAG: S-layer homology domain-containing protein [Oculatellaceae cyanobacterium bins.114]|nr:S-layer homology domain-containing protein [Oculatellaceae cyanobacterium bins.114]
MSSSLSTIAATDTQETVPQLNREENFNPVRRLLAQNVAAGVLTRIDNLGGQVTLRGSNANRSQLMRTPEDRLRVPARSSANIGFRLDGNSGTIAGFLMQAGSAIQATEYWYPCNGRYGRFVIGWSAGRGTPTCQQVNLGSTFRISTRTNVNRVIVGSATRSIANDSLKANFSDTQGHWAEAEIDALNNMGIISGYYGGTFRPDAPVTRAEFAAMINKAFSDRPAIRSGQDFYDTVYHWGSGAIRTAYALGFISGYPEGDFRPDWNVSRVEAVAALATGLGLSGYASLDGFYSDAAQICGTSASYWWACNQITAATSNGIRIQGPFSNWFVPAQQATRADIAVFIYQALQNSPTGTISSEESDILLQPLDSNAAWVLADVTEDRVEVTVLGGNVAVGSATAPKNLSAGQRYILESPPNGLPQEQVVTLSPQERNAIANSSEVTTFLSPDSWLPEDSAALSQYKDYYAALLGNVAAQPPDFDIEEFKIEFIELEQTGPLRGRIRIVGTVRNVGGPFVGSPGQQRLVLGETPQLTNNETPVTVASQPFDRVETGQVIQVVYEREWDNQIYRQPGSTAIVPRYWVSIEREYSPGNDPNADANPSNDIIAGWLSSPASEATCFFGGCNW